MDLQQKKNKLIEARNILSQVFNDSKEYWCDNHWCKELCLAMGSIDVTISKIDKPKPTGIKSIQ